MRSSVTPPNSVGGRPVRINIALPPHSQLMGRTYVDLSSVSCRDDIATPVAGAPPLPVAIRVQRARAMESRLRRNYEMMQQFKSVQN
jgi:hypothetical protein